MMPGRRVCGMAGHSDFTRILFFNPPTGLYRRDDRCQSTVEDQTVRIIFPPIDLALLAAVAREKGAEVSIRDYPALRLGWDGFKKRFAKHPPDGRGFKRHHRHPGWGSTGLPSR